MKKIFLSIVCLCLIISVLTACTSKSYLETKTDSESFNADQTDEESIESIETKNGYVQITGAVASPGVYEIGFDTRLFEVIEMAGGLSEDAAADYVNQAQAVSDGQNIHITSKSELEALEDLDSESESEDDGKVNINTAKKESLMTLPGIGESKADLIIDYRESNGSFVSIEDIMNIQGIKEGVFNKIKDSITVG